MWIFNLISGICKKCPTPSVKGEALQICVPSSVLLSIEEVTVLLAVALKKTEKIISDSFIIFIIRH